MGTPEPLVMPALWKAPVQTAQLIEKEGSNKELFLSNDWSSVQPLGNTEFFCKWQNFETFVQKKALLRKSSVTLSVRDTCPEHRCFHLRRAPEHCSGPHTKSLSREVLAEITVFGTNACPQNRRRTAKRDREELPLRIQMDFGGALGISQTLRGKTGQPKGENLRSCSPWTWETCS